MEIISYVKSHKTSPLLTVWCAVRLNATVQACLVKVFDALVHDSKLVIIFISDSHDCYIIKTSLQCECSGDSIRKSENMRYCWLTPAFIKTIIRTVISLLNQTELQKVRDK